MTTFAVAAAVIDRVCCSSSPSSPITGEYHDGRSTRAETPEVYLEFTLAGER
jgi:hypothetical protein